MASLFDEIGGSSGSKLTEEERICFALQHDVLRQPQRTYSEIAEYIRRSGRTLNGHPRQTISNMPGKFRRGISNQDAKILAICQDYGIDPTKSLLQQNFALIQARVDAKKLALGITVPPAAAPATPATPATSPAAAPATSPAAAPATPATNPAS